MERKLTRTQQKRLALYSLIKKEWSERYNEDVHKGSKTLIAEEIAVIADTSLTTVLRVIKS